MKLTFSQKAVYALIHSQGIGCVKGGRILETADLRGEEEFLRSIRDFVTQNELAEIKARLSDSDFSRLEDKLSAGDIRMITVVDKEYPESMRPYHDKPLALFCRGDITLLNRPSFAVIGTRFPTRYGLRATEEFVADLSKKFVIVSGMARGIDSCAHKTALKSGGKTVAVLGSGVDIVYPPENLSLYRDIINFGLVVSEHEPGVAANSYLFPARNRIISGLSRSVLVTEAGEKSGTMLTINSAIAQGKDVFCVPGSIYSPASNGVNRSIRECQSRAVMSVEDIYAELGIDKAESESVPVQLGFDEETVRSLLSERGEMHVEEILDEVDLSISQLNSLLTRMEAAGFIHKTKHNYWSV